MKSTQIYVLFFPGPSLISAFYAEEVTLAKYHLLLLLLLLLLLFINFNVRHLIDCAW